MDGITAPYRWLALFRDGHAIDQAEAVDASAAFHELVPYLLGTDEDPRKHRMLWFKLTNDDTDFTVSFDDDGDAYISTHDGNMYMTEAKIRSAGVLYRRIYDRETELTTYAIGFGGINSYGQPDGKMLIIDPAGNYKLASHTEFKDVIIRVE